MTTASIVTYHTDSAELAKAIACLRGSSVEHVYVIDNSRDEGTRRQLRDDPYVSYIPSDNVGYGAGHNVGIRLAMEAGARYHIVMNSDLYWHGPVVERCVEYMDAHPDAGQLMPNILYPDGRQQYQCKLIPTPVDLLLKRLLPPGLKRRRMRRFQLEFTGYDHIMDVPYLCGCFMLLRVDALREVGLFDERFFMYPEDIDLTRRMHERYRTVFYPYERIYHVYAVASRKSLRMFAVHALNMVRYFNKWGWVFDSKRRLYNKRLLDTELARAARQDTDAAGAPDATNHDTRQ